MARKVAVVGAGPGGYGAALRAAQLGADVCLIERDKIGGTCLNWGCIPSKVFRTTAEMIQRLEGASEFGVSLPGKASVRMKALVARKEKIIGVQAKAIGDLLARHRVRVVRGSAVLREGGVHVRQADGDVVHVEGEEIILAPGSRPQGIPAFPFDGRRILSSNDVLELDEVPESLLVLGGGVVGCEFASIYASLGSKVTVVEAMSRLLPLPSVDEECSRVLQREMKKRKILLLLESTLERVDEEGRNLRVSVGPSPFLRDARERDRKRMTLEVEKVLVAVGRRPNTEEMGMEDSGVRLLERGWIAADERMETSLGHVYAIGDALGPSRPMLAHAASREGMVAAENALGARNTMRYDALPSAIFTLPEIACVGLTESQARSAGREVRGDMVLYRNLGKAHVLGEIAGMAKIVSELGSGRILGVHIVGAHATDLIGEGALAVKKGCTVKDLAETNHAHPTLAEILMEVSLKAMGREVHG